MDNKKRLLAFTLCGLVGVANAGEKEELLKLRNTTTNLIKELVKQGVLSEKVADEMIKKAEADAEQQTKTSTSDQPAEAGEVRVPYVPDFVKDEIRQQVRTELRADVVSDVMKEAKTQQWGVPSALPEWINKFKISGDLRLRSQGDYMGSDNIIQDEEKSLNANYYNANVINSGTNNYDTRDALINTNDDRQRFRERLRLSIDSKVADNLKAGIRLATGVNATTSLMDPVSTNQSLGNYAGQYQFNVDRAYLKYDAVDKDGFKWLTVSGGRIANPWYVGGGEFTAGSELVWDTDLNFEGFAITARHSLATEGGIHEKSDDKHLAYATLGAFPLQESAHDSPGKWLFGGQLGLDWGMDNQDFFRLGAAYYDYQNIRGVVNNNTTTNANGENCSVNSNAVNFSKTQFTQGGNDLVSLCVDANGNPGDFGLASDFKIVNINAAYDFAAFAPYHVILAADYAKNVGFDQNSAIAKANNITDKTDAWQVRIDGGWPKVDRYGHWNVFALYKFVQANALVDAFTDSDFHLGGTNAKGWVIGSNVGLMKNVWFTGRWLSTNVINGPTYSVDTLQLDLNTRF
ncbi:putative porin [Methylosoma difficile]